MRELNYGEAASTRGVEINISPLIDVVFLLLIFFIVTTVFVEETGVDVRRPRATSAVAIDKNSVMIALTADGRIVYGGRTVALNAVRGIVARQVQSRPSPVIILADTDARTGPLVTLIDECKLAGATQVSVAATRESDGT
jgi:biopolymer transport protein ExbD